MVTVRERESEVLLVKSTAWGLEIENLTTKLIISNLVQQQQQQQQQQLHLPEAAAS